MFSIYTVILIFTLIALSGSKLSKGLHRKFYRSELPRDVVTVDDHVCLTPYPHPHESDHLTCVYSAYYFNKHSRQCEEAMMSCKVYPQARVHLVNAFWVRTHCEGYCRQYMVKEHKEHH